MQTNDFKVVITLSMHYNNNMTFQLTGNKKITVVCHLTGIMMLDLSTFQCQTILIKFCANTCNPIQTTISPAQNSVIHTNEKRPEINMFLLQTPWQCSTNNKPLKSNP